MIPDNTIYDWDDISAEFERQSILLGNGQSRAVWSKFEYGSLLAAICDDRSLDTFDEGDLAPFKELRTENFEQVLEALLTTERVMKALKHPCDLRDEVRGRYTRIRTALIKAIHRVHPRYAAIEERSLPMIGRELFNYSHVYSTNYDLIVYWALMYMKKHDPNIFRFRDFLFSKSYDVGLSNTFNLSEASQPAPRDYNTYVYYLHGALHLYRLPTGVEGKLKYMEDMGQSILDQWNDREDEDDSVPLFISGGNAIDKIRSIHDSRYLDFVLSRFAADNQPLVIFGHSLADVDKHLREAIKASGERKADDNKHPHEAIKASSKREIAVSLHTVNEVNPTALAERQHTLRAYFPNANLRFFRSETHPLGAADLHVG